jgi:hypothetical protein
VKSLRTRSPELPRSIGAATYLVLEPEDAGIPLTPTQDSAQALRIYLVRPILPTSHLSLAALTMALDSFFHNKIESMKLEIIQGQAVLRRLEAQRNDYNSRGTAPKLRVLASY